MDEALVEEADITTNRVAITVEQMEGLLKFIEENPALAKGKTKPQHLSQQLWAQCANKLNMYKDGAKKNGKQWAKTWTDMKYRVRRRALELQAATAEGKSIPHDLLPLSHTEERILSVIGRDTLEGVVIKCDPPTLESDIAGQDSDVLKNADCLVSPTINQSTSSQSDNDVFEEDNLLFLPSIQKTKTTGRKRRRSLQVISGDQLSTPRKNIRMNISGDTENASVADTESALAFIEMEQKKIKNLKQLTDAVCEIRDQMKRLIEVFVDIKNVIVSSRNS